MGDCTHTYIVDEKKLKQYSEDENKLEGPKKLVLRIFGTEYGTCVFEDAKVNFDAASMVTMVELLYLMVKKILNFTEIGSVIPQRTVSLSPPR